MSDNDSSFAFWQRWSVLSTGGSEWSEHQGRGPGQAGWGWSTQGQWEMSLPVARVALDGL